VANLTQPKTTIVGLALAELTVDQILALPADVTMSSRNLFWVFSDDSPEATGLGPYRHLLAATRAALIEIHVDRRPPARVTPLPRYLIQPVALGPMLAPPTPILLVSPENPMAALEKVSAVLFHTTEEK